jgi:transglutaminase-like putative cysteine protease
LEKVTIEELKEKMHPIDTSAVAAILFKKGEVRYEYSQDKGFNMVTEVNTRIKIYKKEGYEWANKKVNYFIGSSNKENVSFSDAVTYNLVAGKIEKTKLKNDGEFDEKINKFWGQKKISMPNIKEGSVIEFQYTLRSPSISSIDEWQFQTGIPVNYSEFIIYVPEYFFYNPNFKGSLFPKVTVDKTNRKINYTYRENASPGLNGTATSSVSNETLDFVETITTHLAENIPAMNEEKYVNNISNYLSSVSYELSTIKYPNSPLKTYSTDWETVTKKIYDYDDFGLELNKTGYFENDVDVILNGLTTSDEKLAAIFTFVKSRMNWNKNNSYYCDEGVRKAYKDKTGNVAEINLMLISMLRYAGLDANPILVSTRSNGIAIFPSRNAFNYVIAGVESNNSILLLDATNKNALPNILPFDALNWVGRIIRKNGTSAEVDLMPKGNSKDVINLVASIDVDGKMTGKVRENHFDYNAFGFREKYSATNKESYLELLEKRYPGIEIGEYEVLNKSDLAKPIVENYTFTHSNAIEIIGDKMYISPMFFFAETKNIFTQEKREYPIDFIFPHQDKYNVSFTIPEGYVVETIPQSKSVAMIEGIGSFKYLISNNGNQFQIVFTMDINQAIVGSEYYDVLKNFFKEIVDRHSEKIVLKKI